MINRASPTIVEKLPVPHANAILHDLRRRRQVLTFKRNAAIARLDPDSVAEMAPILAQISEDHANLDAAIVTATKELAAARAEHAGQLRATLEPRRTAAASQLRTAYAELLAAWRELDTIALELRAAGEAPASRATAGQVELLVRPLLFAAIGADFEDLKKAAGG